MTSPVRHLAARLWTLLRRAVPARRASGVRFLIFHHIRPAEEASFTHLVDYLIAEKVIGEPADALRSDVEGVKYILSFDDGFGSNFDIARRVLDPRGVRALFFICPGLVGDPDIRRCVTEYVIPGADLSEEMERELRFMSWDEVRVLEAAGHTIGSHAFRHRRLSELSGDSLREEIASSKTAIEAEVKTPVQWFAYPFGDLLSLSDEALSLIERTYRFCCTGIRGLNRAGEDARAFYRDHLDLAAPWTYQRMTLEGGLDIAYAGKRRTFQEMWRKASADGRASR
jgi:peptidoglycan/xylan/chitin deacetylase (PgdA/CDA1 family)